MVTEREKELKLIVARLTRDLDELIITVERSLSQCQANATAMIPESRLALEEAREALRNKVFES